jgi:hypothetical protein
MINQATADAVVAILKANDVDGETMEYIIKQTGLTDQMIKQLYLDKQDQEPELDQETTPYIFTREELVTFAAKLIERTMNAVNKAINDVDVDEEVVGLNLDYNNQITIDLDQRSIRNTFEEEINNTIELDNDNVEEEVLDILEHMRQN